MKTERLPGNLQTEKPLGSWELPELRSRNDGSRLRSSVFGFLSIFGFRISDLLPVLAAVFLLSTATAAPDTSARPPAASLTRPNSAETAPAADGFMQRWLILEPIPVSGQLTDSAVRATVKKEYFANQLTVIPHHGDKVSVSDAELTWHAVDTKYYNVNLYHFAYALNRPTSDVLFWAVTIVNCPEEIPGVRLAIGSNAASVWWVNGQEVIGIYGDRQTVIDDGVSKRITLKQGPNVIRCAVINAGGATDFCARFLDRDGKPLKGFTLSVGGK